MIISVCAMVKTSGMHGFNYEDAEVFGIYAKFRNLDGVKLPLTVVFTLSRANN